jgi:hypothetical protein
MLAEQQVGLVEAVKAREQQLIQRDEGHGVANLLISLS